MARGGECRQYFSRGGDKRLTPRREQGLRHVELKLVPHERGLVDGRGGGGVEEVELRTGAEIYLDIYLWILRCLGWKEYQIVIPSLQGPAQVVGSAIIRKPPPL